MVASDGATAGRPGGTGRRSTGITLFLGSLLVLTATSRGVITVCDAEIRYRVARSIWHEGSIFLPPDFDRSDPTLAVAVNRDGKIFAMYGLAPSLLMVPGVAAADLATRFLPADRRPEASYLLGQFAYEVLILPAVGALLVLGVHLLAIRLALDGQQASWTGFAALFATYLLFYARSFGMELEGTCVIVWALVAYRTAGDGWRTVAGSLLLGVAVNYRYDFALPVALIVVLLAIDRWRSSRLGLGWLVRTAAPLLALGLAVLAYNRARTGSIFSTGYMEWFRAHPEEKVGASFPGEYLLPALFGGAKGYLWFSPVFLLVFLVPFGGRPRAPREVILGIIPFGAYLLFFTSVRWVLTEGGWGPRYLAPLTPFLAVGVSCLLAPALVSGARRRIAAAFVLACAAGQFAVCLEDHNVINLKRAKTKEAIVRAEGEGSPNLPAGWRATMVAGRLRDLGIPVGDDPRTLEVWRSLDLEALGIRPFLVRNVWWLNAGKKIGSRSVRLALAAAGIAVGLAGIALLSAALFSRGHRPGSATPAAPPDPSPARTSPCPDPATRG